MKRLAAAVCAASGSIITAAVAVLAITRMLDTRRVNRIWRSLEAEGTTGVFSEDMISGLPAPAQRYLRHAIKPGTPLASSVNLAMSGAMKPGAGAKWMTLTATEIITAHRGFVWRASVKMGMIPLRGADYYIDGYGRVRFALLGLVPVVRASGPDISKSALGRLVIESVWLPTTFLPQNGVTWEPLDDSHARASFIIDGEPVAITLTVSEDGRLEEAIIQRYGNVTETGEFTYIPFGMKADTERTYGGHTIPAKVRAGWWYGTDRYFESFSFTIEDAVFSKGLCVKPRSS